MKLEVRHLRRPRAKDVVRRELGKHFAEPASTHTLCGLLSKGDRWRSREASLCGGEDGICIPCGAAAGTSTPLSDHAFGILSDACIAPVPRHKVNPGVIWKLEKQGLAELRLAVPATASAGSKYSLFVTDAGRTFVAGRKLEKAMAAREAEPPLRLGSPPHQNCDCSSCRPWTY